MPKRFLRLFFAVFLALAALFAGTIYVVDPYYHYHGPVAGLPSGSRMGGIKTWGRRKIWTMITCLWAPLSRPILPWSPFSSVCQGRRGSSLSKADILRIFFFPWTWPWKPIRCGRFFGGWTPTVGGGMTRRIPGRRLPTFFDENLYNDVHYLLSKDTFFLVYPRHPACGQGGVPGG